MEECLAIDYFVSLYVVGVLDKGSVARPHFGRDPFKERLIHVLSIPQSQPAKGHDIL